MKRIWNILFYVFVGIVSFIFFLYLSFPYEVLKERLTIFVNDQSGLNIQIKELEPSLPLGLKLEGVKILNQDSYGIEFKSVSLNLAVFPLLIGNAAVKFEATDNKGGTFESYTSVGLFAILAGKYPILPKTLEVDAVDFNIGPLIDFALNQSANAPGVDLMLKPWLESVSLSGKLNANIELDLDSSDLNKSKGEAKISLKGAVLKSLNKNLPIPDQVFSKALISGALSNGKLLVAGGSGLESNDLQLTLSGNIKQKPVLMQSVIEFFIGIKLGKPLQSQFGIIMDAMAKKETKGELNLHIKGALSPMPTVKIL